jgi:hypothetical protein
MFQENVDRRTLNRGKKVTAFEKASRGLLFLLPLLLAVWAVGCIKNTPAANPNLPPQPTGTPVYFSPRMFVGNIGGNAAFFEGLGAYTIDDTANTFSMGLYSLGGYEQAQGYDLFDSGVSSSLDRGLLNLATTYTLGFGAAAGGAPSPCVQWTSPTSSITYPCVQLGDYAIELPGQAGGFLYTGPSAPPIPLGSTQSCPSFPTGQTFNFVTLPLLPLGTNQGTTTWSASTEAAYGTANISTSEDTVKFTNIRQFTMPGGVLFAQPPASVTGACTRTVYGDTISAPSNVVVSNPVGVGGGNSEASPQALISIGASGMLVEYNGSPSTASAAAAVGLPAAPYADFLGAGDGAVGLPQPAQPLNTASLVSAQYQGLIFGLSTSLYNGPIASEVVSFGFPASAVPSTCSSIVATPTPTMIYGGDFPNNNPGSAAVQGAGGGYGYCDLVIDLGTEDPNNNGIYPGATVYFGSAFGQGNISFPAVAVAVAGQLTLPGKTQTTNAVFLVGTSGTGAAADNWGIYLLQSQ